jgi:uncharacterized protein (DUF885 family)
MKTLGKVLGWSTLAIAVIAGYSIYRIGWGKPFTMNLLANRQALLYLVRNPELFTSVGIADGTVFDRHSGRLAAVGVAKRDDDYALAARFVDEVREFDRERLGRQDQITYDILLDQYQTALAFKRFDWLSSEGLYPITPMWGAQVQLVTFLESQHVVKNDKTARNYVARLEAMGDKLDALTAEMQRQAKVGVVLPVSLLDKALAGIADTVRPLPADNPLVTTFVEHMAKAHDLDVQLPGALQARASDALKTRVYPAYARMSAALEAERAAAATQAAGVGRLPDGAAYYAAMLRQMTTTDYPPAQVHALGLAEVARIDGEMDALLKSAGLGAGTVGARMHALQKDPRFLFPNTDDGRKQVLARYQQILDEVNARMPEYFRTLPPQRLTARAPGRSSPTCATSTRSRNGA